MFKDSIRTIIEGIEKSFEREYKKFDEYRDVTGLNEYKELVVSLRKSDILIKFDKISKYIIDDSNFEKDTYKPSKISNEFFMMSNKKLANSIIR